MAETNTSNRRYFARPEDLDAAIARAQRLSRAEALWWRFSSSGMRPRVDAQQVEREFGDALPDERKRFERILNRDIVMALNTIMFELAKPYALSLFIPGPTSEITDEDRAAFDHAVERVEHTLVTPQMRERTIIRKTSKGPVFEDIRWDISVKKHDLTIGRVDDIPYATVEISYSEDSSDADSLAWWRYGAAAGNEAIYFDCHLEDLESLIRELESVRDNLKQLSSKVLPSGSGG